MRTNFLHAKREQNINPTIKDHSGASANQHKTVFTSWTIKSPPALYISTFLFGAAATLLKIPSWPCKAAAHRGKSIMWISLLKEPVPIWIFLSQEQIPILSSSIVSRWLSCLTSTSEIIVIGFALLVCGKFRIRYQPRTKSQTRLQQVFWDKSHRLNAVLKNLSMFRNCIPIGFQHHRHINVLQFHASKAKIFASVFVFILPDNNVEFIHGKSSTDTDLSRWNLH